MNNLMNLYRNERANNYSKDYAIMQVKIAHRILEYLEPDQYFPPKDTKQSTMDLFLKRDAANAICHILHEFNFDCGSSKGYKNMEKEANEFAAKVLEDYFSKIKKEELSERERLLIRLGELNLENR